MDEYRKYEPIFGSWYLSKLIGKGSFGKVFEITREELGATYKAALKIISVPQDEDDVRQRMLDGTDVASVSEYYEGLLKEIVNENEIMAKLKGNSNIVSYEDHQIIRHDDGVGYDILIRMELLTPLLDRMIERKLDEKEVVRLGIDICKALELCHKKKIIHRDIKPQNIFISDNGDFKLGDFGIARTIEKTTGGMSKKGTYTYMAPEVFRGDPYDETVDLYSLGIVLYTLLNGNRGPFLPQQPAKITSLIEEEARTRRFRGEPLPKPRDAGEMLAMIIRKACAFYPQERYLSAEQMRLDLESYLNNYDLQGGSGEKTVLQFPPRDTGSFNPVNTGSYNPVNTGSYDPVNPGQYNPVNTGSYDPVNPGLYNPANTGSYNPVNTGSYDPVNPAGHGPASRHKHNPANTGSYNPVNTGNYNPVNTGQYNPVNTGSYNPVNTGQYNPVNTGSYNPVNTGQYNPVNTGSYNAANQNWNTQNNMAGMPNDYRRDNRDDKNKTIILIAGAIVIVILVACIAIMITSQVIKDGSGGGSSEGGSTGGGVEVVDDNNSSGGSSGGASEEGGSDDPGSGYSDPDDTDTGDSGYSSYEDPSEYIMPDADIRVYNDWEIESLNEYWTQLAINELFARHGRIFKDKDVREYFSNISWYTPLYDEVDPKTEFNSYEYENYNLLCKHREELKKR